MELDDILKEIGAAAATMGVKFDPNPQPAPQKEQSKEGKTVNLASYEALARDYEDLAEVNKQLKEENDKLRNAAQKLLEDFDKVNTMLREEKAKNANVEELDKQRKALYNEATTLRKKEAAYAKTMGAIHGALETLASELK